MNPSLTSFFYLLTTPYYINNLYKKKNCSAIIFLILVTIKKFIDLKSKTKYINPKKIAQQQKLPILKLKKKKSLINQFYLK